MLSFEEIVQTAIENQHSILEMDLKKGVPLNYVDKDGRYLLKYPDGHIEEAQLPKYRAEGE